MRPALSLNAAESERVAGHSVPSRVGSGYIVGDIIVSASSPHLSTITQILTVVYTIFLIHLIYSIKEHHCHYPNSILQLPTNPTKSTQREFKAEQAKMCRPIQVECPNCHKYMGFYMQRCEFWPSSSSYDMLPEIPNDVFEREWEKCDEDAALGTIICVCEECVECEERGKRGDGEREIAGSL